MTLPISAPIKRPVLNCFAWSSHRSVMTTSMTSSQSGHGGPVAVSEREPLIAGADLPELHDSDSDEIGGIHGRTCLNLGAANFFLSITVNA